ncbi:MAG: sigma-70 family RNA polymerase sigma factor [Planctomycetaceae bacterium]
MSPQVLYLENESWLRTVVRSRVSEPEAVDDIMQNIALALVRQRDSLSEIQRVGSWLYQVAVRQVLMYRRSRGRRRRFENQLVDRTAAGEMDSVEQLSPVDRVLAAEQRDQVREAMDQLDEIDRQILMLKYSENWSYRELSERLGVREDTVEYRLTKARKHLRRLLKDSFQEAQS